MDKMTKEFPRKWQTVLYGLFQVFIYIGSFTIEEAWYSIDFNVSFRAFEHHVRRLRDWGFLSVINKSERPSTHYPIPQRYILSKSGINKLERIGAISPNEAAAAKREIDAERNI